VDICEIAAIRNSEWAPDDFLGNARNWVADVAAHEAVYDSIRGKIGHLIRSGGERDALAGWSETASRLAGFAESHVNGTDLNTFNRLASRLEVLNDLAADAISTFTNYNVASLGGQPHFKACLEALELAGGKMRRQSLVTSLGLKEANGTRVLKVLEGVRLIRRQTSGGREVIVHLTAEGREAIADWNGEAVGPRNQGMACIVISSNVDGLSGLRWHAGGKP
jgi:DNA-binding MarR family transcriptional regulator